MLQPGRQLDLALEALGAEGAASSGWSTLRATGRSCRSLGEIDRGHAAPAELALERVAVGERGLQGGRRANQKSRSTKSPPPAS